MRQLRSLLAPPVSVARDSEEKIQLRKLRLGNRFQSDVLRQVSIIGIVAVWTVSQLGSKFGAAAVTGIIIAKGKLQPFIVTLAIMVAVTGALRLIAGPTAAIYPIYSGTNAPADFDMLRGDLFGILPIQGVFFLLLVIIFGFLLKFTPSDVMFMPSGETNRPLVSQAFASMLWRLLSTHFQEPSPL